MKVQPKLLAALKPIWAALAILSASISPAQADNVVSPFQFAIFYNDLLEFSDCAPLNIIGPVHCNTNIYVGCLSSSSLTFNYPVTTSQTITNPARYGYSQTNWVGPITYNGTPAPGWFSGVPNLTLPIGTNNTSASLREIINPAPPGENPTNPISAQRYYNKAMMRIEVWGTNALDKYTNIIVGVSTNIYTNTNSISITINGSMYDSTPIILSNGPPFSPRWTNWAYYNIDTNFTPSSLSNAWLNTILYFKAQREGRTNHVTQIDMGKLGTWIGNIIGTTNTNCTPKWTTNNPFNGVIYVNDMRYTNSKWMDCVRLTNGVNITNGLYGYGVTIATPNPLYIWGNFNCPNAAYLATTNTSASRPCSVACDAITMLSPGWKDALSIGYNGGLPSPASGVMTANLAMIAGNVPSTDSSATGYSGGLQNLPRLLEDWTGDVLFLNTSMVNLYNSVQATKQFQAPGIYYNPPTRIFIFDRRFTIASNLPPGAPLLTGATATILLSNLSQSYDGTAKPVSASTIPPGLPVDFTYDGDANAPTNIGTYTVIGTINLPGILAAATNTLVIGQGTANITLSNLFQIYDGLPKNVTVATDPTNLTVDITYDGTPDAPINAGSYSVIASISDTNYVGTVSDTLIINPAAASVMFSNLTAIYDGTPKPVFATSVPAGLEVDLTYNGSSNAPSALGYYSVVGTINDTNYIGSATNTLTIILPAIPFVPAILGDGTFSLSFTQVPGTSFTVLATPDISIPLTNWTVLGPAMEITPGQFQFIDSDATNNVQRFYLLRSP